MIRLLTLTLSLFCAIYVSAQVTVTGVVKFHEDHKAPAQGVNVVLKGTTKGAVTGPDGKFSIDVPNLDQTLVFYFLGCITQDVALRGKSEINVMLKPDCHLDFGDARQIEVTPMMGVKHMPLGGQVRVSLPKLNRLPTISASFGYQTNRSSATMKTAGLALDHLIVTCGYQQDVKFNYRELYRANIYNFKSLDAGTYLQASQVSHIKLLIGYSHVTLIQSELNRTYNQNGIIVGLQRRFYPLRADVSASVSLYKNLRQYQAEIFVTPFKGLHTFIRYYRLSTFNEYSLGVGWTFKY